MALSVVQFFRFTSHKYVNKILWMGVVGLKKKILEEGKGKHIVVENCVQLLSKTRVLHGLSWNQPADLGCSLVLFRP